MNLADVWDNFGQSVAQCVNKGYSVREVVLRRTPTETYWQAIIERANGRVSCSYGNIGDSPAHALQAALERAGRLNAEVTAA